MSICNSIVTNYGAIIFGILMMCFMSPLRAGTIGTDNSNCDRCANCAPHAIIAPGKATVLNEGNAFSGCTGLLSVIVDNDVTSINYRAFKNADQLTSVIIGDGVQHIAAETFAGCNLLSSIQLGSGITSIPNEFADGCPSLLGIDIPMGVTTIGNAAFRYCKFTSMVLGGSITSIGENAFYACNNLPSVTIIAYDTTHAITLGNTIFSGCTNGIDSRTVPNSESNIGKDVIIKCVEPIRSQMKNRVRQISGGVQESLRDVQTITVNWINGFKGAIGPKSSETEL